jgi:hypothetical protein
VKLQLSNQAWKPIWDQSWGNTVDQKDQKNRSNGCAQGTFIREQEGTEVRDTSMVASNTALRVAWKSFCVGLSTKL